MILQEKCAEIVTILVNSVTEEDPKIVSKTLKLIQNHSVSHIKPLLEISKNLTKISTLNKPKK
jgi:hypothetical protein